MSFRAHCWFIAACSFAVLSGCCLEVVDSVAASATGDKPGVQGASTGGSVSGGNGSSGSSSSTSGGRVSGTLCEGAYCTAFYACDPDDGTCRCGGQLCESGNCNASTGACLSGCGAGEAALAFSTSGAYAAYATVLPVATRGKAYSATLKVACVTGGGYQIQETGSLPSGLDFYPGTGMIQGVPTETIGDGSPFVLRFEVEDLNGGSAFGDFLLYVR